MKIKKLWILAATLALPSASWAKKPPALRLSVENSCFSPNKDGAREALAIAVVIEGYKKISNWELRVEDSGGIAKRTVTGVKAPTTLMVWDGSDDFGALVPEGSYQISFVIWDAKLGIASAQLHSHPDAFVFTTGASA